jgi:16S rRNA (guanine1207-N2)-methyltransferase
MNNASLETFVKFIKLSEEFSFKEAKILFLRASYHPYLQQFSNDSLNCIQTFKPDYNLLKKAGINCVFEIKEQYDFCWYLATNQRDENLLNFARLVNATKIGGSIFVSMPNDLGPKRFQKHLASLLNNIESYSKNHCRIFYGQKTEGLNQELLNNWLELSNPQKIEEIELQSVPGIFSSNKIDLGSKLLIETIDVELSGQGADLGSAYGYLSYELLKKYKDIQKIYLLEAEKLGLEISKKNLAQFNNIEFLWTDLTSDEIPQNLDWIIMNPPFHHGKEKDISLGLKFINKAHNSLTASGHLFMVANSHLPYEESLNNLFSKVNLLKQEKGFKIYKCKK